MHRPSRGVLISSAAAVLLAGALGACATPGGGSPSASGTTASPSDVSSHGAIAPTPTWPPPLPANALFQITALATASNGATARLTQTVFEPVAQSATDTALLDAKCGDAVIGDGGWKSRNPGTLFLDTSIVAALQPGSIPFLPADELVSAGLPGGDQAYSGPYRGAQAACAAGYLTIPGAAHGVGFVPSTGPALGSTQYGLIVGWAVSPDSYGFAGGGNFASTDGDHLGGSTVVSDCTIQLSPDAESVVKAQTVWAGEQTTGPFLCPTY